MAQLFEAQPGNDLPDVPNYNVCPTTQIHVVMRGQDAGRRLVSMRWGLLPRWYKKPSGGPLLINARGETIMEKPAFREAARARRALVVATGFYEWTKDEEGGRDPWYITPTGDGPLVMAAIWQDWTSPDGDRLRTCAIVTTAANDVMARVHHRMPVILAPQDWALWLGEEGKGAALLMKPAPKGTLSNYRVSRAVNSSRVESPDLIDPVQA